MPQAGKETASMGIADIARHSQLLGNQGMIINFAKHTKLGVAASIWEDRDKDQTAAAKTQRSGEKLERN